ncbi:kinase-like domain-containing protein [Lactifluus volemus]|nr:kinase-like domain-containing protein [Lactifluus volemus]
MANIVPAAGIFEGLTLTVKMYHAAKTIKVHKKRLSGLARQCDSLLSTIREHSSRLSGTAAAIEADEIERSIERISRRVSEWASYDGKLAFLRQNEIQIGIDECYRELATCSDRFTMAMAVLAHSDNETHRQRDFAQLYDLMVRSLEEVQTNSRNMPLAVPQLTEPLTLQEEVVTIDSQQLSSQSPIPPRPKPTDLTGKVSIISQQPDIKGSLLDFYLGEWENDGEEAALGSPRDQSSASQMLFKEWVEARVGLHHRNLLGLFGHVTIGDSIYSVSPWMSNGNIREFIRINPNVDRLRHLSEVACAVEYLHENEIIHGDICGVSHHLVGSTEFRCTSSQKNVLIDGNGKTFVCGFNLSGYLKPSFDITRARWFSPERMTPQGFNPPTEKGDVWSFGSLGIEVFTGKDPYSSHKDFYVPVLLNGGTPPADRGSTTVEMSSNIWDLLESCWQADPTKRPSMSDIQLAIREMLPRRGYRPQSTFPGRDWDSVFTMESASIHGSDRDWGSVSSSSVHRSSLGSFVSIDN